MHSKRTIVLGASENPERYSNKAVRKLNTYGHEVLAIGRRIGSIENIPIVTGTPVYHNIDTVTLYLNPKNQKEYYNYIISLKPKRIIFNPGTENEELEILAQQNYIETLEGCTLVMLSLNQF